MPAILFTKTRQETGQSKSHQGQKPFDDMGGRMESNGITDSKHKLGSGTTELEKTKPCETKIKP